jgi:hypothetical protein
VKADVTTWWTRIDKKQLSNEQQGGTPRGLRSFGTRNSQTDHGKESLVAKTYQ